jgi:hypothetical protein
VYSLLYSFVVAAADMRRLGPVQNVLHATINLGMIKVLYRCDAFVYSGFPCQGL